MFKNLLKKTGTGKSHAGNNQSAAESSGSGGQQKNSSRSSSHTSNVLVLEVFQSHWRQALSVIKRSTDTSSTRLVYTLYMLCLLHLLYDTTEKLMRISNSSTSKIYYSVASVSLQCHVD